MPRISLRTDAINRKGRVIPAGQTFDVTDEELASLRKMYRRSPDQILVHATRERTQPQNRSDRRSAPVVKKPFGGPVEKKADEPTDTTPDTAPDESTDE